MYITKSAKDLFQIAMEKSGKDAFHIGLVVHSCGGKGLDIQPIKKEEAKRLKEIDGVLVDISEEDEFFLRGFTFDREGDCLHIISPVTDDCGCGCGGNCGGNCGCC